jgi:hypothetical protein
VVTSGFSEFVLIFGGWEDGSFDLVFFFFKVGWVLYGGVWIPEFCFFSFWRFNMVDKMIDCFVNNESKEKRFIKYLLRRRLITNGFDWNG